MHTHVPSSHVVCVALDGVRTACAQVNYHSLATVDDGSCITRVDGCTVRNADEGRSGGGGGGLTPTSYAGVDAGTPGFESRFVGLPLRDAPLVPYPGYRAVNNFAAAANVNAGCVPSIEGCMDRSAVNFDSKANANTNTWCIPAVAGCMLPSTESGGALVANTRFTSGAVNFNPLATVRASAATTARGARPPVRVRCPVRHRHSRRCTVCARAVCTGQHA